MGGVRTGLHVVVSAALVVLVAGCDWPMFGYGADGSRASPDTTITTGNIASLTLKFNWTATAVPDTCFADNVWSPVVANGIAYAEFSLAPTHLFLAPCNAGGGIAAFNATTGVTIWTHLAAFHDCNLPCVHIPAVANGIVYDSISGSALDAATGASLWTAKTGFGSSPTVADGIVWVDAQSSVSAVNATSGAIVWTASVPTRGIAAPAVVNGTVYVADIFDKVYALNAWNGAVEWTATTGSQYTLASPAVVDGIVYVSPNASSFDAFNTTTGAMVWTAPIPISVGPAVAGGIVYAGTVSSGPLSALNAWNGAIEWTAAINTFDTPAIANGIVYVGSIDSSGISKTLHAFNGTTGASLWNATAGTFTTVYGSSYNYSSPVVANGFVYIGSRDGKVYAFGLP
jgi:outer membrane protein assembly factor BamB